MTNKKRKNKIARIIRDNTNIPFVQSMKIAKLITNDRFRDVEGVDGLCKTWVDCGCGCCDCTQAAWIHSIGGKTFSFTWDGMIQFDRGQSAIARNSIFKG